MLKNKISKEQIIKTSLEIVRREGINGINARNIAKKLNSSTQPIYYQFKNIEELKEELMKEIIAYCDNYMLKDLGKQPYKQIGTNYINFAKDENELFKILFMNNTNESISTIVKDSDSYKKYSKYVMEATNLNEKESIDFHTKMWIFTHGIATLLATKTCNFTDDEISKLLTEEFKLLKGGEK